MIYPTNSISRTNSLAPRTRLRAVTHGRCVAQSQQKCQQTRNRWRNSSFWRSSVRRGVRPWCVFFRRLITGLTIIPWQYSALIHDFEEFAFARRSHNERYIRVSLGRSSDRIPNLAPYNFGILDGWLAANAGKQGNHYILQDWGIFPEPEGCGVELYTSRAEDE